MDNKTLSNLFVVAGIGLIAFGLFTKSGEKNQYVQEVVAPASTPREELTVKAEPEKSIIPEEKQRSFPNENNATFENSLAQKFVPKYVTKLSNSAPFSLGFLYNYKGQKHRFAMIGSWVEQAANQTVKWTSNAAYLKYKTDALAFASPVFVVIGTGGTAKEVEHLYIIPLSELTSETIPFERLVQFEKKNTGSNFYYDFKKRILK